MTQKTIEAINGVPVVVDPNTPFFLVWTKEGRNPKKSHTSWTAADAEAKRLAIKYPGKKFFVVAARERVYVPKSAA